MTPSAPHEPTADALLHRREPIRWQLWAVAITIVVLRTIVLVQSTPAHRELTGDEPIYDEIARNLMAGQGYGYAGQPWVWKPPGWPIVLAGIYSLLGTGVRSAVMIQGVFDGLTALLCGWLAARTFANSMAGPVAFALVLTWPPLFRESRFLQTEPLFTLAVAATAASFARFVLRPSARWALLAGIAAGVTALVRPTGIVVVAGLLAGWWLTVRTFDPRRLLPAIPVILGLVLVLAPWTYRNWRVFHAFIPVSTGGGELFYMGSTPETDGRWVHDQWPELFARVLDPVQERLGRPVTPVERDRAFMQAGLANWEKDPSGSAMIALKRLYRLCFVPVHTGDRPWLRAGFFLAIVATYVLAFPAGARGLLSTQREQHVHAVLVVTTLLYAIASTGFYTNSRYFEPIRLLLLVIVAGVIAGRAFPGRSGGASPARVP